MNLIDQINDFFGTDAHVAIDKKNLKITIGNRTLVIELPSIAGAEAKAQLSKS